MVFLKLPKKNQGSLLVKIALMIIIAELAGLVGSFFTINSIQTWYETIYKPLFTPPNWVFGPVWLTLYLLMGIAAGLIWHSKSKEKHEALMLFGIQLVLNVIWSVLFFGIHSMASAFVEIIVLWILSAATIFVFYRISKRRHAACAIYTVGKLCCFLELLCLDSQYRPILIRISECAKI